MPSRLLGAEAFAKLLGLRIAENAGLVGRKERARRNRPDEGGRGMSNLTFAFTPFIWRMRYERTILDSVISVGPFWVAWTN